MRPACHGPASLSTQKTEPSFKNRSPVRSVPRSKHFRDSQHYKDTPKSLSMTYTSRGGLPTSRGVCLPATAYRISSHGPLATPIPATMATLPSARGKEGSSSAPLPSQTQGLENLCPGVQMALSFTITFKSLHRCHLPGETFLAAGFPSNALASGGFLSSFCISLHPMVCVVRMSCMKCRLQGVLNLLRPHTQLWLTLE